MSSICIFASDLAVITGHNRYQKRVDLIHKIWKKNFKNDYQNMVKLMRDRHMDIVLEETDIQKVKSISKKYDIQLDAKINTCLKSHNVKNLSNNKKSILNECQDKLSSQDFATLKKSLDQVGNTNFGTKNESNALVKYQNSIDVEILTTDRFFKKNLVNYHDKVWAIGGTIDGIRTDNSIVEIKNRTYKLFYKLRDYEKIQIMAYMHIMDLEKGYLVEALKKSQDCDINVIEVIYDIGFWESIIKPKLFRFIKFFDKFLESHDMKVLLLNGNSKVIEDKLSLYLNS